MSLNRGSVAPLPRQCRELHYRHATTGDNAFYSPHLSFSPYVRAEVFGIGHASRHGLGRKFAFPPHLTPSVSLAVVQVLAALVKLMLVMSCSGACLCWAIDLCKPRYTNSTEVLRTSAIGIHTTEVYGWTLGISVA